MSEKNGLLSAALIIFGAAFCLIYPLSIVWPSGWAWHEGSPASNDYFLMIVGVYATLGLFLIRASKNPSVNASLIWFTVWSSVVHALVMAVESLRSPMQHGHLVGDVPALLAAALVLGGLMSRTQARLSRSVDAVV
jgi:FtsH-binding integral membrane protein